MVNTAGTNLSLVVVEETFAAKRLSSARIYELGVMALAALERESEVIDPPGAGNMAGCRVEYARG